MSIVPRQGCESRQQGHDDHQQQGRAAVVQHRDLERQAHQHVGNAERELRPGQHRKQDGPAAHPRHAQQANHQRRHVHQYHAGKAQYLDQHAEGGGGTGEELIGQDTPSIMRKSIAVVPEGRRVFSRLTVEENLVMGGFFGSKADNQEQMDKVLHLFPRLKERFAQRAGTMSGGEQQMLAIGRALMSKPTLLLLDEPSLGLAPIIIQQIFDIIEQLRKDGVTVFLVEQNANQALKLADRGYVLENGRIVMQGSGEQLLNDPKVRDAYLGG